MEKTKIIITMTSWKKRIDSVGKCLYNFFTKQTEKPDLFYLWLAEEEFPNKEKDLPKELLSIIDIFNVKLCWTKENEYIFKRWHVYPKHYNDLVISIDDDILFDSHLIEEAKKHINETNIIYGIFKDLMYEYTFKKNNTRNYNLKDEISLKYRFLGCSVICPKSFPLDAISYKNEQLRKKICKLCDESWLKPFTIMNETKIGYLPFLYKKSIVNAKFQNSTAAWAHLIKTYDGYRIKDFQLWINLVHFPKHLEKFTKVFPDYNKDFYIDKGLDFCFKILRDSGNSV